jgi:hypothetical protein
MAMNNWDKSNFEFLMSLKTQRDWNNWAARCTDDDFIYAMELIKTAQSELEVQFMESTENLEEDLDLTEARVVLSRFAL